MLKFRSYDIVFQEVPGEVTLALNISGCPNGCKGCHSPHLMEDSGETLDESALGGLLEKYGDAVTCVCFMGGDADPGEVERLAAFVRRPTFVRLSAVVHRSTGLPVETDTGALIDNTTSRRLKTAWYSGRRHLPEYLALDQFDFIKLGPYEEQFGGLDSPVTNQRFYRVENGAMIDVTELFRKKASGV